MRKMKLFYLLIVSAAVLGGCAKTNDNPPGGSSIAVTLSPTTATVAPGDSVAISCTITDQNTLKDVVISETLQGGSASQLQSYQLTGKSYQFNYWYHVPSSVTAGSTIAVTFTVDDASNTQTATATITIGSTNDFNSYGLTLLGSYKDPNAGSFYASSNNQVYTVSTANTNQNLIDMVFYYGSTNQYTLAAPNDGSFGTGSGQISSLGIQNWATKNATSFRTTTLTESDFNAITSGTAMKVAYDGGTNTDTKATTLAAGNIVAFETVPGTANSKYGLIDVKNVTNGDAANGLGQITIQVDVQK